MIVLTKSKDEYLKAFKDRYGVIPTEDELRTFIELYESKKKNQ